MRAKTLFPKSATFICILAVGFMLSACEKVVSIDLNKASPHLVIDGIVTDQQGPYSVKLSLSGDYFEPSLYFPPVSNALVIVTHDMGQRDTLKDVTSGNYLSTELQGIAGRTYSISVSSDGKEYDGSSSMPPKVFIDSLYAIPRTGFGGERGFDIYVMFRDPPELGNYYRVNARSSTLISADSIDGRTYRLFTDKLTNGNEMAERIRAGRNVNPGDTITIDIEATPQYPGDSISVGALRELEKGGNYEFWRT